MYLCTSIIYAILIYYYTIRIIILLLLLLFVFYCNDIGGGRRIIGEKHIQNVHACLRYKFNCKLCVRFPYECFIKETLYMMDSSNNNNNNKTQVFFSISFRFNRHLCKRNVN